MLKRAAAAVLVCVLLGAGLIYWQRTDRLSAAATAQPTAPPPPQVGVLAIKAGPLPLTFTYAGRVAGFVRLQRPPFPRPGDRVRVTRGPFVDHCTVC